MRTINLLDDGDVMDPEAWCRPLRLTTMSGGMSDSYSFASQYSGRPENNVKWCKVKYCIGSVWFGRPISDFHDAMRRMVSYEFVSGDIPHDHQLNMKSYPKEVY